VGVTYVLFVADVFAVTSVEVVGASPTQSDAIRTSIDELLSERSFQILHPKRNILLLDTGAVSAYTLSKFPGLEQVKVTKLYPHALRVEVVERVVMGTWCRGEVCTYYDAKGAQWGAAVVSRGPLLLLVTDERPEASDITPIVQAIDVVRQRLVALGLRVLEVTIPDAAPGDLFVSVNAPYVLKLNMNSDVSEQLETFGILLSEKAKEASWATSYVDLRTQGRVYYK
jgi:cell division septal protein FtsQ